jgi:hypothetical protein
MSMASNVPILNRWVWPELFFLSLLRVCISLGMANEHSWASASRKMPPASAFWTTVTQSGTEALRYRTGSPYSGTGLVPITSEFFFIPVPDWLDTGQSDIPAFKKAVSGGERKSQCTSKLQVVESETSCTSIDSCWWYYWNIICKCRNAGEKLVRHRHFSR